MLAPDAARTLASRRGVQAVGMTRGPLGGTQAGTRCPSPLVAALAQAVIEAHLKRAGFRPAPDGMVRDANGDTEATAVGGTQLRALVVIAGRGRATSQP
jgi:hypothetical protein